MFEQGLNRPAGFWIRLLASILDGLIIYLPLQLISYMITGNYEDNLLSLLLILAYSLLVPAFWNGQTLGKRL